MHVLKYSNVCTNFFYFWAKILCSDGHWLYRSRLNPAGEVLNTSAGMLLFADHQKFVETQKVIKIPQSHEPNYVTLLKRLNNLNKRLV